MNRYTSIWYRIESLEAWKVRKAGRCIWHVPEILSIPEVMFARDVQAPGMEATTFMFLGEMVASHWLGLV